MINIEEAVIIFNDISKSEAEDIKRCLTTLYSVREGEQPLDRSFGLSQEYLDKPMPIAQNMLALEIIEKTSRYEHRVSVDRVNFEYGNDGQLIPVIQLKRGEG